MSLVNAGNPDSAFGACSMVFYEQFVFTFGGLQSVDATTTQVTNAAFKVQHNAIWESQLISCFALLAVQPANEHVDAAPHPGLCFRWGELQRCQQARLSELVFV